MFMFFHAEARRRGEKMLHNDGLVTAGTDAKLIYCLYESRRNESAPSLQSGHRRSLFPTAILVTDCSGQQIEMKKQNLRPDNYRDADPYVFQLLKHNFHFHTSVFLTSFFGIVRVNRLGFSEPLNHKIGRVNAFVAQVMCNRFSTFFRQLQI